MAPFECDKLTALFGRQVLLAVSPDRRACLTPLGQSTLNRRFAARPANPRDLDLRRGTALEVPEALTLENLALHGAASPSVGGKSRGLALLHRVRPGCVPPCLVLPFEAFEQGQAYPPSQGLEHHASHGAYQPLAPATSTQLSEGLERTFGPPGSYGVYLRSDSSVEDLPTFAGAGLHRTEANVVGTGAILDAITRVWASPWEARPRRWRQAAGIPEASVRSGVLIMGAVDVGCSGVLSTTDLLTGGEGLTLTAAWGVGGAVEGEEAQTLVLRPNGRRVLISESHVPYARRLSPGGGTHWVPCPPGPVLTQSQERTLLDLAASLGEHPDIPPEPLDIEFGFKGDELVLFQLRPLAQSAMLAGGQRPWTNALMDKLLDGTLGPAEIPLLALLEEAQP